MLILTHKCQILIFHLQFIPSAMNCAKKGLIWLSMLKSVYLLFFGQNLANLWPKMSLKWPLLVWTLNSYAKFILSTKKYVEKLSHLNLCWKVCICSFRDKFGQILPKIAPNWTLDVRICNFYAKFIFSAWNCVKKWSHLHEFEIFIFRIWLDTFGHLSGLYQST